MMISQVNGALPPVAPAPPAPAPTALVAGQEPDTIGRSLVGQSVQDAARAVEALGLRVRVTIEDGQPQVVTMDYDPERINVGVEGGSITSFEGLG